MDDDDFGFIRREDSVLRKVLTNNEERNEKGKIGDSEEKRKETKESKETKETKEERTKRTGAEGSIKSSGTNDGGSVIPGEYEGVSSKKGGGNLSWSNDENKTGKSNVIKRDFCGGGNGGETSPETGTEEANERTNRNESSSVGRQTPDIPNVVEYHLKVKPKYVESRDKRNDRVNRIVSDNTKEDTEKKNQKDVEYEGKTAKEMRNDCKTPLSSRDDRKKGITSKLSMLSIDNNVFEGSTDLPQVFQVKYLGSHDARGLWGIKHTRKPVDNMVSAAKSLPSDTILPLVKLIVSHEGVGLSPLGKKIFDAGISRMYPIETISYGVQDLVYTRVFSMIVVRENGAFRRISPFECHAFVCESKHHARQLTYALATAFQIYSQNVKSQGKCDENPGGIVKKRFAIDLRSPEEIETDLTLDSEA